MEKEITFEEFSREVTLWWGMEQYTYGSVQFAAERAKNELIKMGVTNATEMYEEYRKRKGESFYYAGD